MGGVYEAGATKRCRSCRRSDVTTIRNVRVSPRTSFTIVRNSAARDARLSFRARGALLWMLSHETGRLVLVDDLVKATVEGRDSIKHALQELEDKRYIVRVRHRDVGGRWYHEMIVTDLPDSATPTGDGFPVTGEP